LEDKQHRTANLRVGLDLNMETVIVQPTQVPATADTPEERGWPPGYFDRTFGSITDDTFQRAPQGDLPKPVDLDLKGE
jgi:hypothetical protein